MERKVLHYVDYIVFGLSLAISLAIGIYYSRSAGKQRSVEEYLMGNRRITCFPVALSLLVTFQSGISLLGLPVEIYYYGTQIYMGIIGLVIGYIIVAALIVPVLHPLQITSVYEVRKKDTSEKQYFASEIFLTCIYMKLNFLFLNFCIFVVLGDAVSVKSCKTCGVYAWLIIYGKSSIFSCLLGIFKR